MLSADTIYPSVARSSDGMVYIYLFSYMRTNFKYMLRLIVEKLYKMQWESYVSLRIFNN